jgi:hypothetical protein
MRSSLGSRLQLRGRGERSGDLLVLGHVGVGELVDTATAGVHRFTVTAASADGQVSAQTITYTALPDN